MFLLLRCTQGCFNGLHLIFVVSLCYAYGIFCKEELGGKLNKFHDTSVQITSVIFVTLISLQIAGGKNNTGIMINVVKIRVQSLDLFKKLCSSSASKDMFGCLEARGRE